MLSEDHASWPDDRPPTSRKSGYSIAAVMLLTQRIRPKLAVALKPLALSSKADGRYDAAGHHSTHIAMDDFVTEVERTFKSPLNTSNLRDVSTRLQEQFHDKLQQSDICMLPSYSDILPSGNEAGDYLAADLGGSTFRIARIRLHGRGNGKTRASEVLRSWDFVVDEAVRALVGKDFFDWMAKQISTALSSEPDDFAPHSLGLSWSFPVDNLPRRAAAILQMGKRFHASDGLLGQDLGTLVEEACLKENIDIKVSAVVNDSAASLLAQIYADHTTSMAVILGTGLNAAVQLPATAFSPTKLSPYSTPGSSRRGSITPNVLVNTELSMFGKDALATTPWDEVLNMMHPNPEFQPLEHFTSGRYLGEIVRLVVIKAVQATDLFRGETPERFGPYELATSLVAAIEGDTSPSFCVSREALKSAHPLPSRSEYTVEDVEFLRRVIVTVSDRSAAYLATAIHALWTLKKNSEPRQNVTVNGIVETSCISCVGSVLGKYPDYMSRVQAWLNLLTNDNDRVSIELEMTNEGEGALVGAAVAVALGEKLSGDSRNT